MHGASRRRGPPAADGPGRPQEPERVERLAARAAAIVDWSDDAIYSRALDASVETWNRGAERMFGYAPEEIVGRSSTILLPPDRPNETAELLARVARGEAVTGFETVRRHRDGREIDVSLTVSPVRDPDGTIVAISTIARDITERKRVRLELERSNEELEQFAYVASHDLSEPLRVIAGFVQLLERRYQGQLDADADRFIAAIVAGTGRMQSMIDALLAYSRVGRAQIEGAEVDTARTVDDVLRGLEAQIAEQGARVEIGELPTVTGDAALLGQLFQNLISNAVKFTGSEPPAIVISAFRADGGWTFSVADNGEGIDQHQADRIFEMFQRLHGRDTPGLGIGLALCERIVAKHGGRIWVEPAPEGGSIFRFTVPDRDRRNVA